MIDKIFGEASGIFNKLTLMDIVISIIYIVIGLIFFTNPSLSNNIVSIFTGIMLVLNGILSIYEFIKRGTIDLYNNNLIFGIILILIGVGALIFGKVLAIILGIYFIASGLQRINYGIFLKKFNESSWLLILAVGIIFMILGVTAFFTNGNGIVSVSGICLLGYGLINLVDVILLRRRSKYFIA